MALKVTTEGLTEGEIAEVIGCRVGAVGLREVGASVRTTHVAEGAAAKSQSAEVSHSPRRISNRIPWSHPGSRALRHPLPNAGVVAADARWAQVIGFIGDEPIRDFYANGSILCGISAPPREHRRVVPGGQVVWVVHEAPRCNARGMSV
jgi:hypothetical protein